MVRELHLKRKTFRTDKFCKRKKNRQLCSIPRRSYLGPLLFILNVNDHYKVSHVLKSIMFVDDTNLFLSQKYKQLFDIVNQELCKVLAWFNGKTLLKCGNIYSTYK